MEDFEGKKNSEFYSTFTVGSEATGYKLHVAGYKGKLHSSLKFHDGMKFSTFDKDQDTWKKNCASVYFGGFWYKNCHAGNPNGLYLWGKVPKSKYGEGIMWYHFRGHYYSLKSISMKIRPVS